MDLTSYKIRSTVLTMTSCAKQLFSNVTDEQFACLTAKAKAAGIDIAGNNGNATRDGIEINWSYDPVGQTLSIQCTSAPFFVSCGSINSKIHDLVDGC
jgi:hypothetical protein